MKTTIQQVMGYISVTIIMAMMGCTTVEPNAGTAANKAAAKEETTKTTMTGSRLARESTDRLVKTVGPDKADEPVRSLGNTVGIKGN